MGIATLLIGILTGIACTFAGLYVAMGVSDYRDAYRNRKAAAEQRLVFLEARIRELEVANRGAWSELDRQRRARRVLEKKLSLHLETTTFRIPTEDEMSDLFNQIPRP